VWLRKLHHLDPIKKLATVLLDTGLDLISDDLFLVLHRVEELMLNLQQGRRNSRGGLLDGHLPVFSPPWLAWVSARPTIHTAIVQERS
jgi:hypothetical protein